MMFATPIAVIGFAFLGAELSSYTIWIGIVAGVFAVAAPVVIWISARGTHAVLCEVRHAVFGEKSGKEEAAHTEHTGHSSPSCS